MPHNHSHQVYCLKPVMEENLYRPLFSLYGKEMADAFYPRHCFRLSSRMNEVPDDADPEPRQ
jgi:hypothetical protein